MTHTKAEFEAALKSFYEGCQRIHAEGCANHGYEDDSKWDLHRLKRWVRIVRPSAFAFVDMETGDVLKTGGYDRPAITKTQRGNIFDKHNGLQHINMYGVSYARDIPK